MKTLQQNKGTENSKNNDLYTQIFSCTSKEEKKDLLIDLSNQVKPLIELGKISNVNDGIISIYKNNLHQEFKTFNNWKKEGFKVIKGSKAFFVWSSPLRGKKHNGEAKKDKKEEEQKEYKFFGMAYLFSNAQVEKI